METKRGYGLLPPTKAFESSEFFGMKVLFEKDVGLSPVKLKRKTIKKRKRRDEFKNTPN